MAQLQYYDSGIAKESRGKSIRMFFNPDEREASLPVRGGGTPPTS